jgi:hypothetical protein
LNDSPGKLDQATALVLMDLLLKALGTRVLCMAALLMTFGLFCWAMSRDSWLSFIVAGTFGLGVLWPVLLVSWSSSRGDKS